MSPVWDTQMKQGCYYRDKMISKYCRSHWPRYAKLSTVAMEVKLFALFFIVFGIRRYVTAVTLSLEPEPPDAIFAVQQQYWHQNISPLTLVTHCWGVLIRVWWKDVQHQFKWRWKDWSAYVWQKRSPHLSTLQSVTIKIFRGGFRICNRRGHAREACTKILRLRPQLLTTPLKLPFNASWHVVNQPGSAIYELKKSTK